MKIVKHILFFCSLVFSFLINAETKQGFNNVTPYSIDLAGNNNATIMQVHDGAPVSFSVTNVKGETVFSAFFSQCINSTTSFDRNYLAFSDGRCLYVFDCKQNKLSKHPIISSIFSVNNEGALCWYDARKHGFIFNERTVVLTTRDLPIAVVHTINGFVSLSRKALFFNGHELKTNSDEEFIRLHTEGERVIVTSRVRYPEKALYKNYVLNTISQQLSLLVVYQLSPGKSKSWKTIQKQKI